MSDRIAQAGLALLAALLIGAGLIAVGGPEEARRQRRDDDRHLAIISLAICISRLDRAAYDVLPAELKADSPCVAKKTWRDPQTDQPFRFIRGESNSFSVCATFETPDSPIRIRSEWILDPATGCITGLWKGKGEIRPMDQFEVVPN
jgi:hypothetical protein